MKMSQPEIDFVEFRRDQGATWGEIGIAFGMRDEAVRSLYRRSISANKSWGPKDIKDKLENIEEEIKDIKVMLVDSDAMLMG